MREVRLMTPGSAMDAPVFERPTEVRIAPVGATNLDVALVNPYARAGEDDQVEGRLWMSEGVAKALHAALGRALEG